MTTAQIAEIVDCFAQGARRAREAGADGDRDPRLQRLPDHAVPLLGDQRPQGRVRRLAREPCALRARDRARGPGRGGRRLPPPVQDQRGRRQRRPLPVGEEGQHARGVRPGLPLARGGGRRRLPRLVGRVVPASAQPRRDVLPRRRRPRLRHDDLERAAHVPQLPDVPHLAAEPRVQVALGAPQPERRRGDQPARVAARSSRRCPCP